MRRLTLSLVVFVMATIGAGCLPAAPGPGPDSGGWTAAHFHPTLACIRQIESGGDGYGANNGNHYGAYQFSASLWHQTAADAGYPIPALTLPLWAGAHGEYWVHPWVQDEVALWVLANYGLGTHTWNECF